MIPDEAVQIAADYLPHDRNCAGVFPCQCRHLRLATMQAALTAAAPFIRARALAEVAPLIRDLTDPDDCWFDHHGGCQAHGYLSLEPGQTCPQHDAKEFTRAVTERGGE